MLFILDILQVTFVTDPIVACGNRYQLLGYELSNENEQCSEAHAYLVPALGT